MSLPSCYCRGLCLLAAAIVALGCGRTEQIQSYPVPKEPPRALTGEVASATGTPPAQSTAPTDRMLAAILPDGLRAWFFKVVGPLAAVDTHAEQISEFFAGIRPAGDQPLPTWKLPEGWTEQPGNAMRAATIVIPGDKPLELTVTSLGWQGRPEDLLSNVNRWRGQMQLPQIGPQQLTDSTRELKVGDATMTVVDLHGRFQSGGMMAPFAGGAPRTGEVASATGNSSTSPAAPTELPAGHPPIGPGAPIIGAQPADVAQNVVPKFEAPKSWQVLPAEGMRKAAFGIADGGKQALVTVIDFSAKAGSMITDPLENVNRWRREIGLAEVDTDTLAKATEPILVDGQAAIYMRAIPDASQPEESQSTRATLAAMVPEGNRIWFIKMTGDRDLVAAEQQHFKDFLKSVRFTADHGATDGN